MQLIKSRTLYIVLVIVVTSTISLLNTVQAQENFTSDSAALNTAEQAIRNIYHWEFDLAEKNVESLMLNYANHPVIPFLEGMILFWESVPTDLDSSPHQQHIQKILTSVERAKRMLEEDENSIDGLFFNLTGRGLLMRYHAAKKQKLKAVGEAKQVYKYAKKAKELKNQFIELYFIVGLYNYFREAYPERYPIYKPLAWFFESGDKDLGLRQLKKVANEGVFSVPEALNYLAYIYDAYEKQPLKGISYLETLTQQYPDNLWFKVSFLQMLIDVAQHERAQEVYQQYIAAKPEGFYKAAGILAKAQLTELRLHNFDEAYILYNAAEQHLEPYKGIYYTEDVWKRLYEGFERYFKHKGEPSKARVYKQKVKEVGK